MEPFFMQRYLYTNMDKRNYGCAMLAGGQGRRMGGANKAELEYGGQTFASTVARELESTGMPCYISTAAYKQAVPKGWKAVRDEVTDPDGSYIGPMGGIYSCLVQAGKDGLDGLFFVPCDAPLYNADIIRALNTVINETENNADAVCFRTSDGRIQTTFGWYSVRMIPAMKMDMEQGSFT